ncbi:MAG: DUF4395 domain-containing protein [Acidimicrobiia bacterium]|nr:DUF4395 domain-containing protein [Acidimicrobiia bacterium]
MTAPTSERTNVFGFPDPVNEVAARVVAGVVALAAWAIVATGWLWLLVPLAYGFWARVLTGPTLSPLGRFAVSVAAPRLGRPRLVPGPPKRFAQGIGAALSTAALVAWLLGQPTVAVVATAAHRCRCHPRVGLRALSRLPPLRPAHAAGRRPRVGVRGVRRHPASRARLTPVRRREPRPDLRSAASRRGGRMLDSSHPPAGSRRSRPAGELQRRQETRWSSSVKWPAVECPARCRPGCRRSDHPAVSGHDDRACRRRPGNAGLPRP